MPRETKPRRFFSKPKIEEKVPKSLPKLYLEGIRHVEQYGFKIELCQSGPHVNHRILRKTNTNPDKPSQWEYRDITEIEDLCLLERVFEFADSDVRDFWTPLFRPTRGETDLGFFSKKILKMKLQTEANNID